jgi:uncharacterized protein with PQ loop repeat
MSTLAVLMGSCAVALAVAISVPQLLRLLRTGQVGGVSLAASANSTISFAAWTVYALSVDDVWLLASSAVGVPGQALTTWLAFRRGASRSRLWMPVTWIAILMAAAATDRTLDTHLAAGVVGASVLWYLTPALVEAWRSPDVSGIAAGSWWVLTAEGAVFLAYGSLTGEPAMSLYGLVCLVGSAAMLARLAIGPRPATCGPVADDLELVLS